MHGVGASFWVHIRLRPEKPADLRYVVTSVYPAMLGMIARSFIRTQSMEFCVPGKATAHKFPGSMDGSTFWPDGLDMQLFPDEVFSPETGVTTLSKPSAALDYSLSANAINREIDEFYSLATRRFMRTRAALRPRVEFSCWGLTRCAVYNRAVGEVQEGWFLKGRTAQRGRFTPILRMFFSHRLGSLVDQYDVSVLTKSHIYSFYDYNDEDLALLLPAASRGRTEAAYSSAELLASNVRDMARGLVGDAPVGWEVDCTGKGLRDFAGDVSGALERFFGPLGGGLQ